MTHDARVLPTLSYQLGRLVMDARARAAGITSDRTIPMAYAVDGELDHGALQQALVRLCTRHDALRVSFDTSAESQLIAEQPTCRFESIDVRADPEPQRARDRIVAAASKQQFVPDQSTRIAATAVRVADRQHVVVVAVDHLIADAWACGLLADELSHLYEACINKRQATLPPLKSAYRDLVTSEQRLLRGGEWPRLVARWAATLGSHGPVPQSALPKRQPGAGAQGGYLPLDLGAGSRAAMRQAARAIGVTPFMITLTALTTVLAETTDDADVAVAVNLLKRDGADQMRLVAPMADLAIVRTQLNGCRTQLEALQRVARATRATYSLANAPYPALIRELTPELFARPDAPIGVVLNMLYADVGDVDLRLSGTAVRPLSIRDSDFRPRSELVVVCTEAADTLVLEAAYQADRLEHDVVHGVLHGVGRRIRDLIDAG